MKLLLTAILLSCATIAQATIIRFSGIVTTADIQNANEWDVPVAQVGDPMSGYVTFDPRIGFGEDAAMYVNGAHIATWDYYGVKITPGGYFLDIDFPHHAFDEGTPTSDGGFGFNIVDGAGTWFAWGFRDPDQYFEGYTGNITRVASVVPDSGSTIVLLALALLSCLSLKRMLLV